MDTSGSCIFFLLPKSYLNSHFESSIWVSSSTTMSEGHKDEHKKKEKKGEKKHDEKKEKVCGPLFVPFH